MVMIRNIYMSPDILDWSSLYDFILSDEDLDVIVSSDDEDAVIFVSQTPGIKQQKEDAPIESLSEKTSESDTLSSISSAADIGVSQSRNLMSDFSRFVAANAQVEASGSMLLPVKEANLFEVDSTATNNVDCTNNQDHSTKSYDLKPLLHLPCASQGSNYNSGKNDQMPTAFQTYLSKSVTLKQSSLGSGVGADTKTGISSSGKDGNPVENFWSYLEGVKEKCKTSSFKGSEEQEKSETSKNLSEQSYCHPKKKLKYSDEFKELFNPSLVCINCSKTVFDKNVSRCNQNHATCTVCLNDMVLLILTRRSPEVSLI